jgi:serine protease Do
MSRVAPTEFAPTAGQGKWAWRLAVWVFALALLLAPRGVRAGEPPAVADLAAVQAAFRQVVDQVTPSVVGIRAQRRHTALLGGGKGDEGGAEQRVVINGSGTVIAASGLILTNEHVVQAAIDVRVLLHDGTDLPATIVGADARSDLAVLQVQRSGLAPVTMCNWASVARGQWAIVLGNPFGLGADGQLSVATGVVSNLGRQLPGLGEVDDRFYNDMIQTTAPISPGHSGGPLFNIRGELIGVVTAMHTRAPADDGIGFAIPLTPAKRRIIELLSTGHPIEYGYLGLTVRQPEPEERASLGLPAGQGAIVQLIEAGGPAASAGLLVGDVIREFERRSVTGPAQLAELTGQSPIGATVRLDVTRNGQPLTVTATVQRRDVNRVGWMRNGAVLWRGLRIADLTEDARRAMNVPAGARGVVVIEVTADSPAERADVQVGNVIERIAGTPVTSLADFLLVSRQAIGPAELTLRERGSRVIAP